MLEVALVEFSLDNGNAKVPSYKQVPHFCNTMLLPVAEVDGIKKCLRIWNESTRRWWIDDDARLKHLNEISSQGLKPREAMVNMIEFVHRVASGREVFFWAKNAAFDYGFINDYFALYDLTNPFHYRNVRDMRCFLEGMAYLGHGSDREHVMLKFKSQTGVAAHTALEDCQQQIELLIECRNFLQAQA